MEGKEIYKVIVQVLKCILKVYLGYCLADILDKSGSKIRTIEPRPDFPGSYKKQVYAGHIKTATSNAPIPNNNKKKLQRQNVMKFLEIFKVKVSKKIFL